MNAAIKARTVRPYPAEIAGCSLTLGRRPAEPNLTQLLQHCGAQLTTMLLDCERVLVDPKHDWLCRGFVQSALGFKSGHCGGN
jgi:hypothetical protein